MGKGDKKSKRGKITIGSYGVRRPRKKRRISVPVKPALGKAEVKKVTIKEGPVIMEEPVKAIMEPVVEVVEEKIESSPEKTVKKAAKETVKKVAKAKAPSKKAPKAAKPAREAAPPTEPAVEKEA